MSETALRNELEEIRAACLVVVKKADKMLEGLDKPKRKKKVPNVVEEAMLRTRKTQFNKK
jgi:hypothetical protein